MWGPGLATYIVHLLIPTHSTYFFMVPFFVFFNYLYRLAALGWVFSAMLALIPLL
ncbi:hypothetical protein DL96DRAFT_1594932 [Flagelloscypha sp. PMI_526]|nr:hypothetical protein DL96DRAFT_1594932 [Flagelloscypha sp. PMI_526]